jgi:hypothetical protein
MDAYCVVPGRPSAINRRNALKYSGVLSEPVAGLTIDLTTRRRDGCFWPAKAMLGELGRSDCVSPAPALTPGAIRLDPTADEMGRFAS